MKIEQIKTVVKRIMDSLEETESTIDYSKKVCAVFDVNGVEGSAELDIKMLYWILQHHQDSEDAKNAVLSCHDFQVVLERMSNNKNDYPNLMHQEDQSLHGIQKDMAISIPPDVLFALQELNLNSNKVNNFSLVTDFLINLTALKIVHSKLQHLPENIDLLVNLKKLDLSNNELCELPASVGKLKNLTSINVSFNGLKFLPDTFTHLNKLHYFNLSNNIFTEVPHCLYIGLPNIKFLDLCKNDITSFDWKPNCALKLKVLRIDYNNLRHLPCWIFDNTCKYLVEVSLRANRYMLGLNKEQIISSNNLQKLNVSDCMLNNANSAFLQRLEHLVQLNLGNSLQSLEDKATYGNSFWDFPLSAANFSCLKELIMCGVGLSMLPEDIETLKVLEYGDFSQNTLSWIPETFCKLVTLMFTSLSSNEICFLPNQLGCLVLLRELCLDGNKVYALPESIINLKNLEHLDLYDNLFESFPQEVLSLPKLKRFDIECNCFDVHESLILESEVQKYAVMKHSLRHYKKWNIKQRKDGRKPPPESSSYSDSETEYESSQSLLSEPYSIQAARSSKDIKEISEEEENWDIEADFDENFDPSLFPVIPGRGLHFETKPKQFVVEDVRASPDNFCPSDKHAPPLIKLRNFYRLHTAMFTVDGQFDDAE